MNISLYQLDTNAIYNIIKYFDNLEDILNLAYTCKEYYNELELFIITSNALLINTFHYYNDKFIKDIVDNSYYIYDNFKYCFKTYTIPLPKNKEDINNIKIYNTELIYHHFFNKNNNLNCNIVNMYYYELFMIKYGNIFFKDCEKIKFNNHIINFRDDIDILYDTTIYFRNYYLIYEKDYTSFKISNYIYNKDLNSSLIINNHYSYIVDHLEIYSISILLLNNKYREVLDILENLQYNNHSLNINYIYINIVKIFNIYCYTDNSLHKKLIILYILFNYCKNKITPNLHKFNKNKKNHYIRVINNIISVFEEYKNNKKYIDCYDICKPAFFIDYMNDKLFNNISNLILVQF